MNPALDSEELTWSTDARLFLVDRTRPYIPAAYCPFTYIPAANGLPPEVILRQNQLHACCTLELIQLFEGFGGRALTALAHATAESGARGRLERFAAEEAVHSAQFAALNRAAEPALYAESSSFFVRPARWLTPVFAAMADRPAWFSFWPWLMLLQEEKSLHLSRAYLAGTGELEPHFVAIHRLHATDEAHHVGWDEELIDRLWQATPEWRRHLNARLLTALIREYFSTPRRAGLRLLAQLVREFPQQAAALEGLRTAFPALKHAPGWRQAAYCEPMLPRTLRRMAAWPEFRPLRDHLAPDHG